MFVGAIVEDRRISRFSFFFYFMVEIDYYSYERVEIFFNFYRNEGKGIYFIDIRKTRGWLLIICLIVYNICIKIGY